ncbi:MAG: protease modulator HflC [Proteobacteria bacterium]|nr:MAG: protease modulator HflC [Pseudomonadota bacterium]
MRTLLLALAAAAALALLATSLVVVDETEHVVITQFGRSVAVLSDAGLHAKLPLPIQRATRLDKRVLFTEQPATELLTADKKNVIVSTFLSWRIGDPLRFLTSLRTREAAEARLAALVQSELGGTLGNLPFSRVVPAPKEGGGLAQVEAHVLAACQDAALRDFGIEVVGFGVTRLGYPAQNLQSVFARMRAERERIARGHRSEGKAAAQKIRAEADRERSAALADAEAEAQRLKGEGEAEAARIYADAYGGHAAFYGFLRTLESYEKVLQENTTLVLPADSPFLELLLSRTPGGAAAPGAAR